ncbi:GGDEF domain-containing protein [Nitrosophilus kaiyonis]|uniref:GGDEF domain-containing protein n=1 Tax=Nitrosophilus kaiyonis TaxID=2930200 RepID=UPI00248F77E9|nr:GGDEF domain-containing protein [Nitrosophilus kaiyonis]
MIFKIYFKYFIINLLIVFMLGFIQQYILYPPFYIKYIYFIIPILIAALLAIFPAILEYKNRDLKEEIENINKKRIKLRDRAIQKNHELNIKGKLDALTGALNKRAFNEIIGYKIMESKHFKTPLTMIIFDIDLFKKINDTYGHPVGDKVLSEFASVIRRNIRKSEIFVRWGGEEFIILLQNTTLYNGTMVAEKLRKAIENHIFPEVKKVTASFGVTPLKDDDTIESFIKRADEALYYAKENGRNRVEVKK